MQIQQVGVVGAGQMGAGIAQVCAAAGLEVILFDLNQQALERGIITVNSSLSRLVSKEKLSKKEMAATLERISLNTELTSKRQ